MESAPYTRFYFGDGEEGGFLKGVKIDRKKGRDILMGKNRFQIKSGTGSEGQI